MIAQAANSTTLFNMGNSVRIRMKWITIFHILVAMKLEKPVRMPLRFPRKDRRLNKLDSFPANVWKISNFCATQTNLNGKWNLTRWNREVVRLYAKFSRFSVARVFSMILALRTTKLTVRPKKCLVFMFPCSVRTTLALNTDCFDIIRRSASSGAQLRISSTLIRVYYSRSSLQQLKRFT